MNPPTEPLAVRITCAEAARLMKISPRTLERYRADRRGPKFFKPPGSNPYYLLSDVTDWLKAYPTRMLSPLPAKAPRNSAPSARTVPVSKTSTEPR